MGKGVVVVVVVAGGLACGLAVAALSGAAPAAAELARGGWAAPIEVPPPQPMPEPPTAGPVVRGASAPRAMQAPVRRRVMRPAAPVARPALPDGQVQF